MSNLSFFPRILKRRKETEDPKWPNAEVTLYHVISTLYLQGRPHINSNCMDLYFSFLATGDSYWSIATRYRISPAIVSKIVPEVCEAIWQELYETEMPPPDQIKWNEIENRFAKRWNFPNCCGAIDGKHVTIQNPGKRWQSFSQLQRNFFSEFDGFG